MFDALDLGCMVISLPMEARPDSELALQLPLDECGCSSLPAASMRCIPLRRCLFSVAVSRIFTCAAASEEDNCNLPRNWPLDETLMLFSDEEYEGFRSCENRDSLFCAIRSCTTHSSSMSREEASMRFGFVPPPAALPGTGEEQWPLVSGLFSVELFCELQPLVSN